MEKPVNAFGGELFFFVLGKVLGASTSPKFSEKKWMLT